MTFELNPKEIELISMWHGSAAAESATEISDESFALLDKLGIAADDSELCLYPLSGVIESAQAERSAENEAVLSYIARHPERAEDMRDFRDKL